MSKLKNAEDLTVEGYVQKVREVTKAVEEERFDEGEYATALNEINKEYEGIANADNVADEIKGLYQAVGGVFYSINKDHNDKTLEVQTLRLYDWLGKAEKVVEGPNVEKHGSDRASLEDVDVMLGLSDQAATKIQSVFRGHQVRKNATEASKKKSYILDEIENLHIEEVTIGRNLLSARTAEDIALSVMGPMSNFKGVWNKYLSHDDINKSMDLLDKVEKAIPEDNSSLIVGIAKQRAMLNGLFCRLDDDLMAKAEKQILKNYKGEDERVIESLRKEHLARRSEVKEAYEMALIEVGKASPRVNVDQYSAEVISKYHNALVKEFGDELATKYSVVASEFNYSKHLGKEKSLINNDQYSVIVSALEGMIEGIYGNDDNKLKKFKNAYFISDLVESNVSLFVDRSFAEDPVVYKKALGDRISSKGIVLPSTLIKQIYTEDIQKKFVFNRTKNIIQSTILEELGQKQDGTGAYVPRKKEFDDQDITEVSNHINAALLVCDAITSIESEHKVRFAEQDVLKIVQSLRSPIAELGQDRLKSGSDELSQNLAKSLYDKRTFLSRFKRGVIEISSKDLKIIAEDVRKNRSGVTAQNTLVASPAPDSPRSVVNAPSREGFENKKDSPSDQALAVSPAGIPSVIPPVPPPPVHEDLPDVLIKAPAGTVVTPPKNDPAPDPGLTLEPATSPPPPPVDKAPAGAVVTPPKNEPTSAPAVSLAGEDASPVITLVQPPPVNEAPAGAVVTPPKNDPAPDSDPKPSYVPSEDDPSEKKASQPMWVSAAIGATVGLFIGGPVGAIVGAGIGASAHKLGEKFDGNKSRSFPWASSLAMGLAGGLIGGPAGFVVGMAIGAGISYGIRKAYEVYNNRKSSDPNVPAHDNKKVKDLEQKVHGLEQTVKQMQATAGKGERGSYPPKTPQNKGTGGVKGVGI